MNPYQELQIFDGEQYIIAKLQYQQLSKIHAQDIQKLSKINLAYDIIFDIKNNGNRYSTIDSNLYKITDSDDLIYNIIIGNLFKVKSFFDNNNELVNSPIKNSKLTPLYFASKAGQIKIIQYLLSKGGCLIEQQISTPIHVAALNSNRKVLKTLFHHGMKLDKKNSSIFGGYTPLQQIEKHSNLFKELSNWLKDPIYKIIQNLRQKQLIHSVGLIRRNHIEYNQIVVKRLYTNQITHKNLYQKGYITAFHGTKTQNLESILRYGLLPSGIKFQSICLSPHTHHIELQSKIYQKQNWGRAVFASPSIFYAADQSYSQIIESQQKKWVTLLQIKVKEGIYEQFNHTFNEYQQRINQPSNLQLRISGSLFENNSLDNIIIISVLFIQQSYLQKLDSFEKATQLLHINHEQNKLSKIKIKKSSVFKFQEQYVKHS